MITKVNVTGNQATVILSGDSEGAAGYDYVISTDRDCITNKDYTSVNKNQVSTSTTFKYVQQETYYAYCHAWKRDENGKKVIQRLVKCISIRCIRNHTGCSDHHKRKCKRNNCKSNI